MFYFLSNFVHLLQNAYYFCLPTPNTLRYPGVCLMHLYTTWIFCQSWEQLVSSVWQLIVWSSCHPFPWSSSWRSWHGNENVSSSWSFRLDFRKFGPILFAQKQASQCFTNRCRTILASLIRVWEIQRLWDKFLGDFGCKHIFMLNTWSEI